MYKLWLWGWLLLLVSSCDSQEYLEQVRFSSTCWAIGDTLTCHPGNWSEGAFQEASLFVDFSNDFSYRNIILQMNWELPSGAVGDTLLRAHVVDSLGYWIPSATGSDRYRYTFPSFPHLLNQVPRQLSITQYMRDSSLCGIYGTGISLRARGDR